MQFLNESLLAQFPAKTFSQKKPYPNFLFKQMLNPDAFDLLYREFPDLKLFEKHVGLSRGKSGQRPHNRYYMALDQSIYNNHAAGSAGVAELADLPQSWQDFLHELQTSKAYHAFLHRLLGVTEFNVRYAWHVGEQGSEVSPHRDSPEKLATHIFYFNTSEDWNLDWGGSILVLDGKKVPQNNPEISDFKQVERCDIRDNSSFLFQNTKNAWHAVEELTCPEGQMRRLFNLIIQVPAGKRLGDFEPNSVRNFIRKVLA